MKFKVGDRIIITEYNVWDADVKEGDFGTITKVNSSVFFEQNYEVHLDDETVPNFTWIIPESALKMNEQHIHNLDFQTKLDDILN